VGSCCVDRWLLVSHICFPKFEIVFLALLALLSGNLLLFVSVVCMALSVSAAGVLLEIVTRTWLSGKGVVILLRLAMFLGS